MRIHAPYGKFQILKRDDEPVTQAHPFLCPECGSKVYPANVTCITCQNCGNSGGKQQFSAVLRKAA